MELKRRTVAGIVKPLVKIQNELKTHVDNQKNQVKILNQKIEAIENQKATAETEISQAEAYSKNIGSLLDISGVKATTDTPTQEG